MSENNKIILYQDDNEIIRVSVRFSDEDLWLTQNQLAEIYCTTQQNISQHVDNIYKDGELFTEATNKKFLLVRQEGKWVILLALTSNKGSHDFQLTEDTNGENGLQPEIAHDSPRR